MKSLGARGIRFDEYSKETNELLTAMSQSFKGHRGPFSKLANALQPDMGIYYYKDMPIGKPPPHRPVKSRTDGRWACSLL